jgi:hypothetical protein
LLISLAQKKASGFWKRQGHGQLLHVRRELFVTPHAASEPTAFDHAGNRSNISATGKYTKIDISTEVVSKFSKKFENTVATIQKKKKTLVICILELKSTRDVIREPEAVEEIEGAETATHLGLLLLHSGFPHRTDRPISAPKRLRKQAPLPPAMHEPGLPITPSPTRGRTAFTPHPLAPKSTPTSLPRRSRRRRGTDQASLPDLAGPPEKIAGRRRAGEGDEAGRWCRWR